MRDGIRSRLSDSLETALKFGNGIVHVEVVRSMDQWIDGSMENSNPSSLLTPNSLLTFSEEVVRSMDQWIDGSMENSNPSSLLTPNSLLTFSEKNACVDCGISLPDIDPQLFSFNSPKGACPHCDGLGKIFEQLNWDTMFEWMHAVHEFKNNDAGFETCPHCHGKRLNPAALSVTVGEKNIADVVDMSVDKCATFFEELTDKLSDTDKQIARQVLKEIKSRLKFLRDVGLEYLTLSRKSATLSGGEFQRIRLATQIGSALTGVLYVLDEPSIGLHQHDNEKLLETLKNLRDLGNTLLVVEHDEETMRAADMLVDIGPGAGKQGGEVVAQGTADEVARNENSLTGDYLSGRKTIPMPTKRRKAKHSIGFVHIHANNLRDLSVKLPLGVLTIVTGVSGSGKSTLVERVIFHSLYNDEELLKSYGIETVIKIDQDPIGRSPRSNVVTYTKIFDRIRKLFGDTQGAQIRGYTASRFSFNVKGGRCETCGGNGVLKIPMNFLPDVYVTCEVCNGARFNAETLEVKYKGKSIADVLAMSVDEALEFFGNVPAIKRMLQVLHDVGLGYIELGQPANTLSGGESQRVKLAAQLARPVTQAKNMYIMDEPTTGLHFDDVKKLIDVVQRLVNRGDTVLIIEHNLDVIKCADYIIDLGPDGGDKGGQLVAFGRPEEVAQVPTSYTGQALKKFLKC
ncbi:MAG: excinuclease ABC subunit UvrA [Selenomonadaceae bacterium]|nr:excinuclease ABC subunit UvrA [Selenomonadaceae bacterium]